MLRGTGGALWITRIPAPERRLKASRPTDRALRIPLLFLLLAGLWISAPRAQDLQPGRYLGESGFRLQRDSLFEYSADSLHLRLGDRVTFLHGNSRIQYQNMDLVSDHILLDWPENSLEAWVEDSTADWSGLQGGGSVQGERLAPDSSATRWVQFEDGTQSLLGKRMQLDIRTRHGRVTEGRSRDGESRYGGREIRKVAPSELHIGDALFTTCDAGHPHFHFEASKLKMVVKDKVVAKDVWLHFGEVPTLYSPVALFSLERGRASGLIVPSWNNTAQQGRGLRNIGWYWAASRYWDTQLKASYFDKGPDVLFSSYTPYVFSRGNGGALSGGYSRRNTDNTSSWDLYWRHNQALTPYVSLKSDVRLASSRSIYDNASDNLNTRLTQRLTSNLSLSGSFPQQRIRYSLSANADQDLENETVSGTLPALSINYPNWTPLAEWGDERREGSLPALLGGLVVSASSRAQGKFTMSSLSLSDMERQNGAQHSLGLSLPGKLGYFSLTPSFRLSEEWVDESFRLRRNAVGAPDTLHVSGLAARRTFNFALSTSTAIYGQARPNIGRLIGLRHVLKPRVTATVAPDFSRPFWGYVEEMSYIPDPENTLATKEGGNPPLKERQIVRLDRFQGGLYGGTPTSETRRLSFSLDNLFQAKLAPKDSGDVVRTDLLSINSSSGYNFTAESFRLSDLGSRYSLDPLKYTGGRLGPLGNLNLSLNSTHSFYKVDYTSGQRIDEYVWQGDDPSLPRLTRAGITLSTSFKSSQLKARARDPQPGEGAEAGDEHNAFRDRFEPEWGSSDLSVPWDANLSWTWNRSSANPNNVTRQNYARVSGSLRFSGNWKASTSIHYDWVSKRFSASSLRLYRDMHCWEGWFTWDPRSSNPGYYLLIRVKSSFLQDLKWEKKEGRTAGAGF